jgi:hypothetical protein
MVTKSSGSFRLSDNVRFAVAWQSKACSSKCFIFLQDERVCLTAWQPNPTMERGPWETPTAGVCCMLQTRLSKYDTLP